MGSQSKKLIEGHKYKLISDFKSQSWNNGICVLDSIILTDGRALVTNLNTNIQFNVPISQLYELVIFICIKEGFGSIKVGDVVDWCTMKDYENINFREHFKPLAEYREERINQILDEF
jgi:hypothetical protein